MFGYILLVCVYIIGDDCSAGVGRTGTFLAVDYLLNQAAADGSISVAACVENLRKQRTAMVQSVVRISDPIKGIDIESLFKVVLRAKKILFNLHQNDLMLLIIT